MSRTSSHKLLYSRQFSDNTKELYEDGLTAEWHLARYLPYSVLTGYWTYSRIKELLDAFDVVQDPKIIQNRYLRVLSTLVSVSGTIEDSVSYIENIISYGNDDFSLPWNTIPQGLQNIPGSERLFSAVFRAQWSFCPVLMDITNPMSNTNLQRQRIFPFKHHKTINLERQHREAIIRIMDVHPAAHAHLNHACQTPARVVLKTYPHEHGEQYDNERKAFGALNRRSPNILQCLGSYTWLSEDKKRTSTLILEHAKFGTLLDLFNKNRPPYTAEDIKTMWLGVLEIAKGLEVVHEQVKCVHQDLKPSNILIFPSENGRNDTSRVFKIADFGASYMPTPDRLQQDRRGIDRRTSRTYCPPELHLNDEIRYSVDYECDMWAMGCILMEIAVWISFGEGGREDFRKQRMNETNALPDHQDLGRSDCFHDGSRVLQCVSQVPEWIGQCGRKGDTITLQMVQHILHHLLVEKNGRCQAKDLYVKMRNVINGIQSPLSTAGFSQLRDSSTTGYDVVSLESRVASPTSFKASPVFGPSSPPSSPGRLGLHHHQRVASDTSANSIPTESSGLIVRSTTNGLNQTSYDPAPSPTTRPPPTPEPIQHVQPKTVMTRAFPNLTLSELEEWIRIQKRTPRAQSLPGEEVAKNQLRGRDFVLLIDNSNSMQAHRAEVLRFVYALSYLVKELDPDGLQVLLTSNPRRKETCKTATRATEFVERTFTEGSQINCNMEHALGHVLRDIRDNMSDGTSPRKRTLLTLARSGNNSKPTTVLVFTDGVWNPSVDGLCGVDGPIEQCIRRMKQLDFDRPYVALQFLRFGTQAIGEKRLRILDDELKNKAENQNFDIVDHKPTTAGIWDILVGSVSQDVDD